MISSGNARLVLHSGLMVTLEDCDNRLVSNIKYNVTTKHARKGKAAIYHTFRYHSMTYERGGCNLELKIVTDFFFFQNVSAKLKLVCFISILTAMAL